MGLKFQAVTIVCNEKNYYSFRIFKPLFIKIVAKLDEEMNAQEVKNWTQRIGLVKIVNENED